MSVSAIIPARNETYLEKTIRNVLENATGDIEVIAILDGYLPEPRIDIGDDRVKFLHYEKSIGQRKAINEAAKIAKGKFIMKLDAHCAVGKGFDEILAADCKYEWTMVPTMYNLQVGEFTCKSCKKVYESPSPIQCKCGSKDFSERQVWKPKKRKVTNYMYITSPTAEKPFRAQYYEGKEKDDFRRQLKNDKLIDETMCCMGPGWFMHKDRFLEQGGCDEGHGSWGQQGVEVSLKAWLSGGALMVNKKTWFAHYFRGGSGPGFPYKASGKEHEKARRYSRKIWLNNKWDKQTRSLKWLIDKFNPPGWREVPSESDLQRIFYRKIHLRKNDPTWRGIRMIKMPSDITLYHMAIWDKHPDFVVEIGTAVGGSAMMFGDFLSMTARSFLRRSRVIVHRFILPLPVPAFPSITVSP